MDSVFQFLDPGTRWDFLGLGPGSANKSGALLALAIVGSVWFGLAFRWGWWITGALLIPLGLGLLATGSRGGILAAMAGLLAVGWSVGAFRKWRPSQGTVGVVALAVVLLGLVFFTWGPGDRFVAMVKGEDPSANIRWEMYSAGFKMLSDAPGGWGDGRASDVFRHWYQDSESPKHFLSLVNSHLTWMTERGMGFRILYAGAWGLILGLLWPGRSERKKVAHAFRLGLRSAEELQRRGESEELREGAVPEKPGVKTIRLQGTAAKVMRRGGSEEHREDLCPQRPAAKAIWLRGIAFGLWVCLGVGAFFSSTLTWPGMWVLPVFALFLWLGLELGANRFPWWSGLTGVAVALVGLMAVQGVSLALPREVPISGSAEGLGVGSGEPTILLVGPEEGVLGDFYGRALREALPENGGVRVLFEKKISREEIEGIETIVFCGGLPSALPESDSEVRWVLLNPSTDLPENWEGHAENREILVLLGSASGWQQRLFWEGVAAESDSIRLREVAGAGRYLPGWEKLVVVGFGTGDAGQWAVGWEPETGNWERRTKLDPEVMADRGVLWELVEGGAFGIERFTSGIGHSTGMME